MSIIQSLFVRTVHFLTIGMAILLLGMVPVGASAATSQLACTPTNLGFGAVVVGQTETLLVALTNNGQSSVTVSGIAVGRSGFTTSNLSLPLVLLAGQSVDLSISFTPTAMGWTRGTIKFSSNASNATLRLHVAGTGASSEPVTASPSMVSFGQVAIGTISTVPVVLTNARSWKVTLSALQTTGGGFSMSGPSFPLTLGAGQSVTVNVAFAPQSAGTTGGKLFVSGPGLAIPLTGTGTAPCQLTSNLGSLNFANVPVGNSQAQSVTLTNSGGSGLTVSHATLTGTGFTLSGLALPLTLGAGQSATFSVVFAPQSAGSASGNLAFTSNASNSAMNLPLSGNTALVAITVNPNNATLVVGSTQQFTANVTGTSKTAVAWTVSGARCIGVACGTISVNGLYVPPSSVPSPATVTVKATSVADPNKSASANMAIVGAVVVLLSITPTSASVPTAGMQPFTASVTGTSNTAVTWGLSGAGCIGSSCGTLATSSLSAVYLAPSVAPTPASVNVIATSVVDPTKSASANIIIVPAVVVGVTPANVSATVGATQQFAASVTGTSNTAVAWTVSGTGCSGTTCGTISSSGLYTAPAAVPSPATVTTTATSVADPTKSASADVTVMPIVGTTYYLATADDGGNDSNDGLSPAKAWRTIARVNLAVLHPGDSVLFNRGGIWREQLTNSSSGAAGKPITYGAYGMGPKPSIRGSDIYSKAGTWTNEGNNFWYTLGIQSDPGVFVHDGALGLRRTTKSGLSNQWDYWYDLTNSRLYVYSTADPATVSALLEIAVKNSFAAVQSWSYITYDNLDIRHFNGSFAWLGWGANNISFQNVDFSELGKYALQFNNGSSNGIVSHCTFTDWGVVDGQDYAVHVVGTGSTQTTGPVDVLDSTFTINHSMNNTELAAVLGDIYGWVRNVQRNTAVNNGKWPGSAFWTWRPGGAATSITFESNSTYRTGSSGIAIQELNYNGAAPVTKIRYNYIEDADQLDVLDTEALRVRSFNPTSAEVSYNIINRTKAGANLHPGIYLYGAEGAKVYGNTVYGTDDGILVKGASLNNDILNNISAFNRQHGISVQDISTVATSGNNLFYANGAGNYSGIAPGAGDVTSVPKFISNNPSSPTSFALQVGSPAINAGAALGSAYSEGLQSTSSWPGSVLTLDQSLYGAWEIGAFAYPH